MYSKCIFKTYSSTQENSPKKIEHEATATRGLTYRNGAFQELQQIGTNSIKKGNSSKENAATPSTSTFNINRHRWFREVHLSSFHYVTCNLTMHILVGTCIYGICL